MPPRCRSWLPPTSATVWRASCTISVTQIIFGLTLSAQAARILLDRDPARVAAQLDHMQVLAQNALAEMRALIQQLHPHSIAEEGLGPVFAGWRPSGRRMMA